MNWFYAENGQQRGPVSEAEFDALVASGSIQPSKLVWREGMAKWQPLSEVRPIGLAPGGPPPPPGAPGDGSLSAAQGAGLGAAGVLCSVCGKSFTEDQVIRFGPTVVCAGCKPVFLQRLREGTQASSFGAPGTLSTAELLATDYTVDIGGDLGRSWEVFKADAGTIIGASVLVVIAFYVSLIPAMLIGIIIPFGANILMAAAQGIMFGGIWHFYIRKARGESVGVGDAFSGFGPQALHLALSQVIPQVIVLVVVLVVFGTAMLGLLGTGSFSGGNQAALGAMGIGMIFAFVGVMVVLGIVMLMWVFAIPLVIDKKLKFWPAMELSRKMVAKHFLMTLLYFIVSALLSSIGMMACFVGMLVTGPWAFGALAQHYNRVFGRLRQGG